MEVIEILRIYNIFVSVGRRYINEILLDKGDTFPNIRYHFNHKLVKADLDRPQLTFLKKVDNGANEVWGYCK